MSRRAKKLEKAYYVAVEDYNNKNYKKAKKNFVKIYEYLLETLRRDKSDQRFRAFKNICIYLGKTCYLLVQTKEAIKYLDLAIEIDPTDDEALNYLGIAYLQNEDYAKALVVFEHIVEHMPDKFSFWMDLLKIYEAMGDLDKVIATCLGYLKQFPEAGFIWYRLGEAYQEKEMHVEAIGAFKEITDISSSYKDALEKIAYLNTKV